MCGLDDFYVLAVSAMAVGNDDQPIQWRSPLLFKHERHAGCRFAGTHDNDIAGWLVFEPQRNACGRAGGRDGRIKQDA